MTVSPPSLPSLFPPAPRSPTPPPRSPPRLLSSARESWRYDMETAPGLSTGFNCSSCCSGQELLHHPGRLDPGEALVEALVADREALVVVAEEVQDGGVEVVDVH